jgi:hypothetical protein
VWITFWQNPLPAAGKSGSITNSHPPNGEHFWADYLPGNLKPARKNVVRVFQKCNTPDDLLW